MYVDKPVSEVVLNKSFYEHCREIYDIGIYALAYTNSVTLVFQAI